MLLAGILHLSCLDLFRKILNSFMPKASILASLPPKRYYMASKIRCRQKTLITVELVATTARIASA